MSNEAAWINKAYSDVEVSPADTWSPGSGEILIKNESISFNPIEAKIQRLNFFPITFPAILGFSFAGSVLKVGPDVTSVNIGDVVAVARWGATVFDARFGAFQKFPLAKEANVVKLSSRSQLDDASAVMMNLATVVSALSIHMRLDRPPVTGKSPASGKTLLVYGGSSGVGGLAVSYAVDAGYKVVTTSSPKNRDFVSKRNPAYIVDHTQAQDLLVADLKAQGPYDGVFDAIGSPAATEVLGTLLAETGGVFYSTWPASKEDKLPENVKKEYFQYGMSMNEEANRDVKNWYLKEYLPRGLENGNVFSKPILKLQGGLNSVQDALDGLYSNAVGGVKLVVNPQV